VKPHVSVSESTEGIQSLGPLAEHPGESGVSYDEGISVRTRHFKFYLELEFSWFFM
jgi:hypothetical protein